MLRRMLKTPNTQCGWILIDSLLGVVIISVACTAIMLAYTQSTKATGFAANRATAISIAQRILEGFKSYDGGATAPPTTIDPSDQKYNFDSNYKIQISNPTVNAISGNSRIIPVQVTVSWPASNPNNSIQMVSYYYLQ